MIYRGILYKNINYFETSSAPTVDENFAYLLGLFLEHDTQLGTYTIESQESYGSGSTYAIRSIAELGCTPLSYSDYNCPNLEIPESSAGS